MVEIMQPHDQGVDAITNLPINISVDKGSFTIAGITNEIADFQRAMDDDNAKLTAINLVPVPVPTPDPIIDPPLVDPSPDPIIIN
jgi:hypothetical protein